MHCRLPLVRHKTFLATGPSPADAVGDIGGGGFRGLPQRSRIHRGHRRGTTPSRFGTPHPGPVCERKALHLETSGVDPLSGQFDWITLSPKRHRPPREDLLRQCNELKVVIHNSEDLTFAESMATATANSTLLLLQPGWDSPNGQQLAVDHARSNPRWRLSLQTHKWLGVR